MYNINVQQNVCGTVYVLHGDVHLWCVVKWAF
jgi:hypothetical protein